MKIQIPQALAIAAPAAAANGANYVLAWKQPDNTIWWTTCPASQIQNSSGWAPIQQIEWPGTDVPLCHSRYGPALACVNGRVWLAWTGNPAEYIYLASLNGSTWTFHGGIYFVGTRCAPALSAFGSQLFLAFKGDSDRNIYYLISEQLTAPHLPNLIPTWNYQPAPPAANPPLPTPYQVVNPFPNADCLTDTTPALAGITGSDGSPSIYLTFTAPDKLIWHGVGSLNPQLGSGIFWFGGADLNQVICPMGDGGDNAPPMRKSRNGPAVAYDSSGGFYMAWRGASDNNVWASSPKGKNMIGLSLPPGPISGIETIDQPALASTVTPGIEVLLAWRDQNNGLWVAPLDSLTINHETIP